MSNPASWLQARETVLLSCRRLQTERLVFFTAGNISMRITDDPGLVAVTPSSTPYDTMRAEDVAIVDLDGRLVDGMRQPTTELPLHTLAYRRRDDVGGIVHTHSAAAMAVAAMGIDLPPILHGLIGVRRRHRHGAVCARRHGRGGGVDRRATPRAQRVPPAEPRCPGDRADRGPRLQRGIGRGGRGGRVPACACVRRGARDTRKRRPSRPGPPAD